MPHSRREFTATLTGAACAALTPFDMAASAPPAEGSMALDEITDLTAVDLAARLARKDLSAREVVQAHLARIERSTAR